ncbi:disintegrin and metalloproteinase domain-containing protein 9-like isoform X1 [Scleropages formosus]|uniref:ADAM metallopeptidase domain 9a n=1 Tax=Scleropages formosus TaxID=113540 RepID=A0A8C9RMU6_SCLFO|nr:disintegrin and metalloproteinase domain-containing protein 9-like isoform X1 [Scleropages formosus]
MAVTSVRRGLWLLSLFAVLLGLGCASERSGSDQTSRLLTYELTIPKLIGRERRHLGNGLFKETSSKVSYVIRAQEKDHIVVLEKNEVLLPKDFTMYSYAKNGSLVTDRPLMQDHCHYQGYVKDVEGSSVAMSICSGLRGVLHIGNSSYGIEPLESASSFQHLVYRLEDVVAEPLVCATTHREEDYDPHISHELHEPLVGPLLRRKRDMLHQTHYVELFLVVDNDRFAYKGKNQTAVQEEMVHLANYIDSVYVPLNIRVVLVGLEIWSQRNLINTEGSAGEVLSRFVQWREQQLLSRHRHDSGQLILNKSFGGTAGMAFVGTVCSRSHGGGINAFTSGNTQSFASIVAHELGHNLGMNHDDDRSCRCAVDSCIMNSGASGSRNFSSCSADDFEKLILNNRGRCLLNVPRPEEAYIAPCCGNKLVDVGEECDCGSEAGCEKDPCCEAKTCKLKPWAQCADDVCCKHCRFLPAGSVCRNINDECDLPEYCNGSSALCQSDVYKQNGHPCKDNEAYCYNGKCQHYTGQCQAIFGTKATVAPEIIFKNVNQMGDRFGNCGYQGQGYKKCKSRDAMCGKLQCENVQSVTVFGIQLSIIQTPVALTKCWEVDFMLGSDAPDLGMVNEGTKCGENKVCLNYECVGAEVLKYDCEIQNKCHGHGVCNNNKNCHCDDGWAPPFCEAKGYGGSMDSGPTWNDKDTSTRDGLLVFFFLVLPLLVLGGCAFIKRNELQHRFCGPATSYSYNGIDSKSSKATAARRSRSPPQSSNHSTIVRDGRQFQLLPPEEVVQTSRTAVESYYPKPPYHTRPPVAKQLLPQRPAPPPPL